MPIRDKFPRTTPINSSPKTGGCPIFSISPETFAAMIITEIHNKVMIIPWPDSLLVDAKTEPAVIRAKKQKK